MLSRKFLMTLAAVLMGLTAMLSFSAKAGAAPYKYDPKDKFRLMGTVTENGYDFEAESYAYKRLTADQKQLYLNLKYGALKILREIEVPKGMSDQDIAKTISVFADNEPELFWYKESTYTSKKVKMVYYSNKMSTVKNMQKKINSGIADLIKSTKGKSDAEKVRLIHQFLLDESLDAEFKTESKNPALYDVLVKPKKGKKVMYPTIAPARAFKYLCGVTGVQCITTRGREGKVEYAYNMVRISKKWYNVAVGTNIMNERAMNRTKKAKKVYTPNAGMVYYLCDDTMLSTLYTKTGYSNVTVGKDKSTIKLFTLPKADSTDKYYFVTHSKAAGSESELYTAVKNELKNAIRNKSYHVNIIIYKKGKIRFHKYDDFEDLYETALETVYPDLEIDGPCFDGANREDNSDDMLRNFYVFRIDSVE